LGVPRAWGNPAPVSAGPARCFGKATSYLVDFIVAPAMAANTTIETSKPIIHTAGWGENLIAQIATRMTSVENTAIRVG